MRTESNVLRKSHSEETKIKIRERKILHDRLVLGEVKKFEVRCGKCGLAFFVSMREKKYSKEKNYYCSRSCANSRVFTESSIKKKSIKTKQAWKRGVYDHFNYIGRKGFRYTSKGETEIKNYFKTQFLNDKWTSGGRLKIKNEGVVRDLYSNKLKVCIEYDGIWHFKNIHNQLEKKQYKDRLLEEWCKENGFRLIRIKEEVYLSNKEVLLKNLIKEVYEGREELVKFY